MNGPSKMVINANYGLGVAREVDTDTIMVNRLDDDKLLIKGYQLGSKEAETVLGETARMETLVTSKAKQNRRCIQDNQITCLCEMAIKLENVYYTVKREIFASSNFRRISRSVSIREN